MELLIILSAALLPAILLWLYIWKKDTQKEPTSRLIKAVLWGVAIIIPVAIMESGIETVLFGEGGKPTSLFGTTTMAFVVAALPEETFKLLALWMVLRRNPYFDEHFDGIVYAVCVGLGFAAFENIMYVFGEEDWFSTAIVRALLAVPGHYAFAILMGYYYSVYHFVDHSPKVAACVLLVPVLAHGTYDALAMSGIVSPVIGGLSFFVLVYFCVKMHKVAKAKVLALVERDENSGRYTV
jgi:RsiW-degrading membrane proteinase PrsW (M82 family)